MGWMLLAGFTILCFFIAILQKSKQAIERGGLMAFHQGASDHILWEGYAFFFHLHSLLYK
jgi:hypothetical protein